MRDKTTDQEGNHVAGTWHTTAGLKMTGVVALWVPPCKLGFVCISGYWCIGVKVSG